MGITQESMKATRRTGDLPVEGTDDALEGHDQRVSDSPYLLDLTARIREPGRQVLKGVERLYPT